MRDFAGLHRVGGESLSAGPEHAAQHCDRARQHPGEREVPLDVDPEPGGGALIVGDGAQRDAAPRRREVPAHQSDDGEGGEPWA